MTSPCHVLTPGPVQRSIRLAVLIYVLFLVAVPLVGLVHFSLAEGFGEFWDRLSEPVARAALWLTIWTAVLVGGLNTLLGTATAWVLVRYRIPARAMISALVDLPLAIPTLVAGIMMVILYGPTSLIGRKVQVFDMEIAFAQPGIVLALLFVTLPFVVRAVEPVLLEVDPEEEEAAVILGAGPFQVFRTVFLPAIAPAAVSGGIRSLGRALGEFGSIVIIAGNIPFKTLTAPVFIFGEIESGASLTAAAVSVVLLAFALALHALARLAERHTGVRNVRT